MLQGIRAWLSKAQPTQRDRLPNRRSADTFDIHFGAFTYTVSPCLYPDGRIGELFIEVDKSGTELATVMHDASIAISLALQHGCPVETLSRAFLRNENGEAAGLLGLALDRATGSGDGRR